MRTYTDEIAKRSYYHIEGQSEHRFRTVGEALLHRPSNAVIDPVSVLSVLTKNYVVGTRTLVEGIRRTPWMAEPDGSGRWSNVEVPLHGEVDAAPDEVASELIRLLKAEALSFLRDKGTVGLLLSGGMDSRVVAAVVRSLQIAGEFGGNAIAITWGIESSRDVSYARHIATNYQWELVHLPLTPNVLMHNIFVAADRGAEYSPVHLHAMPSVANLEGIDGVLAGSYGDSIGRAEYSGTHASDLRPILAHDLNQFSMLNSRIEKQARKVLLAELVNSRQRFPGRTEQQYREIEMQMHYMNRQLNPCLSVIDDAVPVQQMFTSLPIVSYIWNLSFASRTDQVYRHLLNELDSRLLELPWARTGRLYSSSTPSMHDDSLSSLNNHYGRWLRHDLRQYITEMIRSGYLQQLNIFSEKALEKWVRRWSRSMRPRADRLDEKMAWLASLALFVKKHEVQGLEESFERTARDGLVLTFSQVRYLVYQVYLAAKNK